MAFVIDFSVEYFANFIDYFETFIVLAVNQREILYFTITSITMF